MNYLSTYQTFVCFFEFLNAKYIVNLIYNAFYLKGEMFLRGARLIEGRSRLR